MAKIIQINNLRIDYSKLYEKWRVRTPDGRNLEEFSTLEAAKRFARSTTDFVRRRSNPSRGRRSKLHTGPRGGKYHMRHGRRVYV